MKKSILARGFIGSVASLLGVMAVGCGADVGPEGAAGNGEIGSVEQALTSVASKAALSTAVQDFAVSNPVDITDPVGRYFAASCEIRNGGVGSAVVKLLVGGFDVSGNPLRDAYMFNPATNQWAEVAALASGEERGHAKLIQVAPDKCLLVGGSATVGGASPEATTWLFTANGDEGSWANAGNITGRTFHDVIKCGSENQVIVIGGHTGSGFQNPVTLSAAMQIWNGSNAWSNHDSLLVPVSGFALAQKSPTRFAIVGGVPSGAEATNKVQAYELDDETCEVTWSDDSTVIKQASSTSTDILGRFGGAAFFDTDNDDLYTLVGTEVTTTPTRSNPTDLEKFTINWGTSVGGMVQVNASGYSQATRFPAIEIGNGRMYLVGGEDAVATKLAGDPQAALQEIVLSSQAIDLSLASGSAPKLLGPAVTFTSSKLYISTGEIEDSVFAVTTNVHEVTP